MYTKKHIPTPFLQQPILSENQTMPVMGKKVQPNHTAQTIQTSQTSQISPIATQQKNTSGTNPAVLALVFLLFQGER